MTVSVEVPRTASEVPRFLIGAAQSIGAMASKSVWGYLGHDFNRGLFVTGCRLDVDNALRTVFIVDGVTHDGMQINWTRPVSEIDVSKQPDNGIAFTTGHRYPSLVLYLL